MKKRVTWALMPIAVLFFCIDSPSLSAQEMNEMWGASDKLKTESSPRRGRFFAEGNYAMFIHWGLFSEMSNKWKGKTYYGIGEWLMHPSMANIPADEYMPVAKDFNPVDFNARQIAQLAKDAGMKYIVITSKHHDGFAMFHSKVNDFNIVEATPFGRDPMKELAEACREAGLGFGFYYSHNQDWTYPGGNGGPQTDNQGNIKTFDDYFFEKCLPQVEEITKNYGEIELIWFDTPGGMPEKYAKQLVEVVHRNQPHTLVSGRVGYNLGDYHTLGDMEVPLENVEGLWESVDVTNDAWGYAWYDENWKTPKQLLTYLISTIARGGTYMLNVGPDGKGQIPELAQKALRAAGKWIHQYPTVIYGAKASPWKHALPWGDVVLNNNKMYLTIYDWPANGELWLPGLETKIASVSLLNGDKKEHLSYKEDGYWTQIKTPAMAPEAFISVIEVELEDAPKVNNAWSVDPYIGLTISSKFGTPHDCSVTHKSWMEKFGEWKHIYNVADWNDNASVTWEFMVKDPGIYHIDLTYSGEERLVWELTTDEGQSIQNQQNSSHTYMKYPIGWLTFNKAGKHTITVRLKEGNREKTSLKELSITPVRFE